MIIILTLLFILSLFCGWDWLTQDTELSTGTLQGVTTIAQTPDMWGDVGKAIIITLLVVVVYLIVCVPITGVLMRGGGKK